MEPKPARMPPRFALAGLVADWKAGALIVSSPRFFGRATGPSGASASRDASVPVRRLQSPAKRRPDLHASILILVVPGKSNTGGPVDVH